MRHFSTITLTALSPVAHFDTRTGVDNSTNIRLFMTQPILLNGRMVYAPHVSENALRTAMLRRPLADHLVRTLGLEGQLPRAVLNLLYSGGAMGSAARVPGDETTIGHGVGKLYPSLALLGGAVDAMILPRSKLTLNAWLVAQEYADALAIVAPSEAEAARQVSAWDLLGNEVRTRGTGDESDGNQMLYEYQVLAAGSRIVVQFGIDEFAAPEVAAALAAALREWDGYIGGQGRQGRGRMLAAPLTCDPTINGGPEAYDAHIAANADTMRDGLRTGTLGAAKPICVG